MSNKSLDTFREIVRQYPAADDKLRKAQFAAWLAQREVDSLKNAIYVAAPDTLGEKVLVDNIVVHFDVDDGGIANIEVLTAI